MILKYSLFKLYIIYTGKAEAYIFYVEFLNFPNIIIKKRVWVEV